MRPNTTTYTVRIDIEAIPNELWEQWCDTEHLPGVRYSGVQEDGYEHWEVNAVSETAALDLVDSALGDWPAHVVDVTRDVVSK